MKKVVYLWCDGNIPFYVGKGDADRPYSKKSRNRRIKYKRDCCEKNRTFNVFIVASGLSNEYACFLEKSIIKNNPQLFNYTFGGDGGDTFTKLSEKEKIRRRQLYSDAAKRNMGALVEIGKKFGKYVSENKLGAHGCSSEQLSEWGSKGGKIAGKKNYELGIGIFGLTSEQKSEVSKKGGEIGGRNTSSQRWMCLETGYVSNPGGLSNYQRKRGIDTSQRKRIENCP
jgi:hypothetical protein